MSDAQPYGLGRRKTAIAQVRLAEDVHARTVNGKPFEEYFTTEALQATALKPLELTSQQDEHGVEVKVSGGGPSAQAEAVSLGIARALLTVDEGFRKQLKDGGMLTRDPRAKERKKPGLRRARRARQFSKR